MNKLLAREQVFGSAAGASSISVTAGPYGSQALVIVQAEFDEGVASEEPPWQVDLLALIPTRTTGTAEFSAQIINDGNPSHRVANMVLPVVLPAHGIVLIQTTPNDREFDYKLRVWALDLAGDTGLSLS